MKRKKCLQLIMRIVVSGGAFYFIFKNVDFASLRANLSQANVWFLLFSFACILSNYGFSSLRWQALAAVKGIIAPLTEFIRLYFIGAFFNNFLPTSVGGDVVKAYKLTGATDKKVDAVSSVFIERLAGVSVLALVSWSGFIYYFQNLALVVSLFLAVAVVVGFWLAPRIAQLHPLLNDFYSSVISYKDEKAVLLRAGLISLIVQLCAVSTQYLVFLALGIAVPFTYCVFVIPLITLATMLPISINGLGVQDGLYVFFFERVGVASEQAIAVSLTYHGLRLLSSLIGGVLYLFG